MQNVIFKYVKREKGKNKGQPIGVVVAVKNEDGEDFNRDIHSGRLHAKEKTSNKFRLGYSLEHKLDRKRNGGRFDKERALEIAKIRATDRVFQYRLVEVPHSIKKEYDAMYERARRYFKL
jgi:hypothetical protein